MTQILDKFIQKAQKITKWTILQQNEVEILVAVPVDININVHYKNISSSQEHNQVEPRIVTSLFLCTTNPKSKLAFLCRKSNLKVIDKLTSEGVSKKPDEIEETFNKMLVAHYDLFTKRGDGH